VLTAAHEDYDGPARLRLTTLIHEGGRVVGAVHLEDWDDFFQYTYRTKAPTLTKSVVRLNSQDEEYVRANIARG
jgi:hypothetical protein